jgi:hypothetical protein
MFDPGGSAMSNRAWYRPTITLGAVVMGLALVVADAPAQSHPKYMVNGHGLALTRFAVHEQTGSSWTSAKTYQPQRNYRITLRLTNFYPPVNMGARYDRCHVTRIVDVGFDVSAAGIFYPDSSYSGNGLGSVYSKTDPQPLKNTDSRSYYLHFKWTGPPLAVSQYTHKVNIWGGEVCLLPTATAPIVATP